MEEQKNKGIVVALIIFIILTILLGGYIVYDKFLVTDSSNTKNNENQNEVVKEKEENNHANIILTETIELKNEREIYGVDKLYVEFNGTKNLNDDSYSYTANIRYEDKIIDNSFFNDVNNYRIWSSDIGNFTITEISDIFILESFYPYECFYDHVMILNKDGEVLLTAPRVDFSIDDDGIITIVQSDSLACAIASDKDRKTTKYKIEESHLIELNN